MSDLLDKLEMAVEQADRELPYKRPKDPGKRLQTIRDELQTTYGVGVNESKWLPHYRFTTSRADD